MDGDADSLACVPFLFGDVAVDGACLLLNLFDLPPGVVELSGEPFLDGAQFGEALDGRKIGHVFESMAAGRPGHAGGRAAVDDQRYHLALHAGARPVMHGWWASRPTAEAKFTRWIGEHGTVTGARVTLVDEETGETLTTWPDET